MQAQTTHQPKNMRTFIIILVGELISMLGSGLTGFALGVWIFAETGKATPFAIAVLFGSLPPVLLAPWAGSLADRWDRRKIILITDTGSALVTLAALLLLVTGNLEIWTIYIISALGSVFGVFQETAFQASVVMLVPKKDLPRANGMASTTQAVASLVTPVLAGVLFALIGLEGIMVIDFVTFFAAIAALMIVRIPMPRRSEAETEKKASVWDDTRQGWDYVRLRKGLLGMVFFFMMVNFLINFSSVLMGPLVLTNNSAAALGTVQMFGGVGMLIGSLVVSAVGIPKKHALTLLGSVFLVSMMMGVVGFRDSIVLMSGALLVTMFFLPFAASGSQAIFQVKVPADMQGRVMAIRTVGARLMMPLAFLISGPLADNVFEPLMLEGGAWANTILGQIVGVGPGRGIGLMFMLAAVGGMLVTVITFLNPRVRNVETELPDVIIEAEPEATPERMGEANPVPAAD